MADKVTSLVFRELLQNSDDARAQAVEIRFETKSYLERDSHPQTPEASILATPQSVTTISPTVKERLPDLKTTHVCCYIHLLAMSSHVTIRCIVGRFAITV